ncbi:hypothetical protein HDU76_003181 [Blyttiomyces sp. JEL0837]|nr:hypothetical protein HDU76_003181 [Blyttiomyces sp. JEL0837]
MPRTFNCDESTSEDESSQSKELSVDEKTFRIGENRFWFVLERMLKVSLFADNVNRDTAGLIRLISKRCGLRESYKFSVALKSAVASCVDLQGAFFWRYDRSFNICKHFQVLNTSEIEERANIKFADDMLTTSLPCIKYAILDLRNINLSAFNVKWVSKGLERVRTIKIRATTLPFDTNRQMLSDILKAIPAGVETLGLTVDIRQILELGGLDPSLTPQPRCNRNLTDLELTLVNITYDDVHYIDFAPGVTKLFTNYFPTVRSLFLRLANLFMARYRFPSNLGKLVLSQGALVDTMQCFFNFWRQRYSVPNFANNPFASVSFNRGLEYLECSPHLQDKPTRLEDMMSRLRTSCPCLSTLCLVKPLNAFEISPAVVGDGEGAEIYDAKLFKKGLKTVFQETRKLYISVFMDDEGRLQKCLERLRRKGLGSACSYNPFEQTKYMFVSKKQNAVYGPL